MKKKLLWFLIVLFLGVGLAAWFYFQPLVTQKKTAKQQISKSEPTVTPLMQENFQALIDLQKSTVDRSWTEDPEAREAVKHTLEKLIQNSQHIPAALKRKNLQGLAAIADVYAEYLSGIPRLLERKRDRYAQKKMRTVSHLCMSCHTGMGNMKGFQDLQTEVEALPLNAEEKAHFYAATRQLDKAAQMFSQALDQPLSMDWGGLELIRTAKAALSISVRVQQNPEQTNKIVERLLRKDLPEFVREDVEQWKRDVHSWQSEEGSSVPATATEFLSKAKELVGQAQQLQSYYADHSADLRFLRVVHYANQLFGKSPTDAEKAEAFLLLAISYEALRDPLLWDVNEYYYEACVRALPHSEVARTCYQRLSSEIYYGYTGSGGTDIPWDEQERLKKYRNLAQ